MKTIGYASKESGVGIETIRYYEREGVIPPVDRTENGRRSYSDADVDRLRFIKRCRALGFSISSIRNLQQLAFSKTNSCEDAAKIGRNNLNSVRSKIDELRQMETALTHLVTQCERSPDRCPMLEGLDLSRINSASCSRLTRFSFKFDGRHSSYC